MSPTPGHKPPCNGRLLQTHCHMKHPFSLCPVGHLRLTPKVSGLLGLWQQGQFCWMTWTFSASSLFRISHQTFLLVLFPSVFYYSWFSILESNLRVGRLSSWIFFYSLWVLSAHSGSGREWGQPALCAWALPWSSCKGDRQGFQQQHFPPKACKTLEPGKAASSARATGSQKEQFSIFPLSTNHIIKP